MIRPGKLHHSSLRVGDFERSKKFYEGLLGFRSVVERDYPVVFANLYIFSLLGLFVGLLSDLLYTWVDPRIDFERRDV